jgi:hypothetical protein
MRFTCLAHPIPLYLIILLTSDDEQKWLKCSGLHDSCLPVGGLHVSLHTVCSTCAPTFRRSKLPPSSVWESESHGCWSGWEKKCQVYGKVGGNLAFFWTLRHPCDPDCYPEDGDTRLLRNVGTHTYQQAYTPKRIPSTEKTTNFSIMKFSPPPCYFFLIRSKHSLHTLFSHTPI